MFPGGCAVQPRFVYNEHPLKKQRKEREGGREGAEGERDRREQRVKDPPGESPGVTPLRGRVKAKAVVPLPQPYWET